MANKLVGATCPHCGASVVKNDKYIFCEKSGREEGLCHFITSFILKDGKEIPEEDLIKLTKGEKIGPYTFHSAKKDKDYRASLQADTLTGTVNMIFANNESVKTNHLCPICSATMVKRIGKYGPFLACPEDHFNMSISFGGVELTDADIDTVLNGGKTAPMTLYSRTKQKEYEACVGLDPETHKLRPYFDEN